jgi:glycosyltransferase involved in cell wall biosynthesis
VVPPTTDRAARVAVTLTQCWHRVPGGTATSVLDLVRAMQALDEVELVGVGPRGGEPERTFRPPVPVHRWSLPLPLLYDAWDRVGRPSAESAVGPVDLVHLTVPMGPPRTSAPLVATVHDVLPLSRPDWFTGRGARLMSRALGRVRDEAAAVVVPSRVVADDCVAHGFDPARLVVVPWGSTPVHLDEAEVVAARARHGLRGPYVLFVGTREPRKGLSVLADAMVHLDRPDVTLVVAGPAGWGVGDDAHLAGVPGPVISTGFLPAAELAALERGAAAFCYPTRAEGFGLPVLEALAAGAPVVTTSDTAAAEVVGDAALLVPPGEPRPLADALARLLEDPALADDLRAAGPARAATFTWPGAARAVLDVYRSVLGPGTGS